MMHVLLAQLYILKYIAKVYCILTSLLYYRPPAEIPVSLVRVVQILQLMYHMALDAFDRAAPPTFTPPDVSIPGKDVSF